MDPSVYKKYYELESIHFWRVAKRNLAISFLTDALGTTKNHRILDIGSACTLFPVALQQFGTVTLVEPHEPTVRAVRELLRLDVRLGSLPNDMPVDGQFDVITMLDVLEHISDEQAALVKVRETLTDSGIYLITVPAYMWLWSDHDIATHHVQRYTVTRLRRVLVNSGFNVERISYYTSLLFPVVVMQRLLKRGLPAKNRSEYNVKVPPWPVNLLFGAVMRIEAKLMHFFDFPWGLSIIAVCRKRS